MNNAIISSLKHGAGIPEDDAEITVTPRKALEQKEKTGKAD